MKNEHDLFSHLERLTLGETSKARMREALLTYADLNQATTQPSYTSFSLFTGRFALYSSFIAVLLVGSGGISLASETSVPGNPLYSIKVHVNEPVLSTLAFSESSKARVAGKIASRRLEEITVLAQRDSLDDATQVSLETAFEAHVEQVALSTQKLDDDGETVIAEEIRSDFASTLSREAQALAAVKPEAHMKTKKLLVRVIALSSDSHGDEPDAVAVASSIQEDVSPVTAVALLSTTTATSTTETVRAKAFRPRTLLVGTSTTFTTTLYGAPPLIAPTQDTALQDRDSHDDSEDNTLRLGE